MATKTHTLADLIRAATGAAAADVRVRNIAAALASTLGSKATAEDYRTALEPLPKPVKAKAYSGFKSAVDKMPLSYYLPMADGVVMVRDHVESLANAATEAAERAERIAHALEQAGDAGEAAADFRATAASNRKRAARMMARVNEHDAAALAAIAKPASKAA